MRIETKKVIVFIVFLLVVALVAVALFYIGDVISPKVDTGGSPSANETKNDMERVYIDGVAYLPRSDVKNYLLIGVDAKGEIHGGGVAQADSILLLSVNKTDKTYKMIAINRDTMTKIAVCDIFGNKVGERVEQLALSHAYGSSFEASNFQKCKNTVNAVSDLLYGVKFVNYMSMTTDAVSILVDTLGGVEVTVPEDMTMVDDRLVMGEIVLLDGELAVKFIGARGGLEVPDNISRMERQKLFLDAFMDKLGSMYISEQVLMDCYDKIDAFTVTDSGIEIFDEMSAYLSEYTNLGMSTLEGEAVKGEKFMEFYVDEVSLKELVIDNFYRKDE